MWLYQYDESDQMSDLYGAKAVMMVLSSEGSDDSDVNTCGVSGDGDMGWVGALLGPEWNSTCQF